MAEERNLGVARAADEAVDDEDATKVELQRRMEEARESISQTVTEIKDTVTNQYQAVRQSVTEALDWREQYRRRPLAWSVGALSVGVIVGYSLGGALMGNEGERAYYTGYEEDYDESGGATADATAAGFYEAPRGGRTAATARSSAPSYAPQAITGAAYGASSSASDYSPSYGGETEADEPDKPGLLDRFKETKAYDRLQEEVASLGDRLLNELSNVGQTVVLPMLFNKIKDLFGVDLSNKQQSQSSSGTGETSGASGTQADAAYAAHGTGTAAGAAGADRSQASGSASGGGGGYSGSPR
ncbi:MAG TPA: hypothetical protein VF708_21870 [Pyrinomonadaceae bacterium]|jgi:ElaB/YqjD/DUF883 family membrane-anchored ribosome-binding protein